MLTKTFKKERKKERKKSNTIPPAYMVVPTFQNTMPNIIDTTNVLMNRTTLCSGFFQYAHLCFHRQAMHCALKFCQYLGGKFRSSLFGIGFNSLSSIKPMFSLKKQRHKVQNSIMCLTFSLLIKPVNSFMIITCIAGSSDIFLRSPLQSHILLWAN